MRLHDGNKNGGRPFIVFCQLFSSSLLVKGKQLLSKIIVRKLREKFSELKNRDAHITYRDALSVIPIGLVDVFKSWKRN